MASGFFSCGSSARKTPSFGSSSTAEQVTAGIDASDRVVIVTGASSGIGLETVRVLALRGAEVVLAVRNVASGEKVKEEILKDQSKARLHVLQLDLASLASVRRFCQDFQALNLGLNILINNAGVMACPFSLSEDGIELQFATNHVGHFLLTSLLLDKMKSTAKETGIQGRIVNVSSNGHKVFGYSSGIRFDKLNDKEGYGPWKAYGQSKLANILFTKEPAKRLQDEGLNVAADSLHPGLIPTNLTRSISYAGVIHRMTSVIWKTIPQGAATQCLLALHPSVIGESGSYFVDCKERKLSAFACDPKAAKDLWGITEILVASKK